MPTIRKMLPKEIALYSNWHYAQQAKLIDAGLYPKLNLSRNQIEEETWAVVAPSQTPEGFFRINSSDEVDTDSGWLVHDFAFHSGYKVEEVGKCIQNFLKQKFKGEKMLLRFDDGIEKKKALMSTFHARNIDISVTMLKKDFSNLDFPSIPNTGIRTFIKNSDEDIFAELYYEIFKEISPVFTFRKIREWLDKWTAADAFDPELYLIAEDDNIPAGIIAVEFCNKQTGLGHLYEIGVKKEFRNKNVAHLLFSKCLTTALAKGLTQLLVRVKKRNQRAYRFFENCGFKNLYERHYISLEN